MTNSGSIIITNGGYWDFDRWDGVQGDMEQNAGNVKFLTNTFLQFTSQGGSSIGTFNHNGGNVTFYSDNAGTIPGGTGYINMDAGAGGVNTNTYNLNGGILSVPSIRQTSTAAGNYCTFNFNGGTLKAAASSTTFLQGLNAVFVNSEAKIDTTNNTITIAQTLLAGGSGAGLTKTGTGTLNLNGTNTYTGMTTVNGGLLGGVGTIAGSVMVNSGAGVAPGNNGIGILTVNGNLTLNAGTTNVFELNTTLSTNDSVALGASVSYGGVLKVVTTGTLTVGQQFQLFRGAGAVTPGTFSSIVSTTSPGATFSFANGVLTVVSIINVNPPQIQMSVSGSTMTLAWPTNAGWILQWQTNSLSTGLSTNWVPVPGSESMTSTNIPINSTNPSVFYRLALPQ
jgi:autotransporter-associated beta strand protein